MMFLDNPIETTPGWEVATECVARTVQPVPKVFQNGNVPVKAALLAALLVVFPFPIWARGGKEAMYEHAANANQIESVLSQPDISEGDVARAMDYVCGATEDLKKLVYSDLMPTTDSLFAPATNPADLIAEIVQTGDAQMRDDDGSAESYFNRESDTVAMSGLNDAGIELMKQETIRGAIAAINSGTDIRVYLSHQYRELPGRIEVATIVICRSQSERVQAMDQAARKRTLSASLRILIGGLTTAADILFAGPSATVSIVSVPLGINAVSGGIDDLLSECP